MKATTKYIIDKLCKKGFDTYIVGGAVRDLLLGINPKDEDVVTAATPNEIIKLFQGHDIREVGKSFKASLTNKFQPEIPALLARLSSFHVAF